LACGFSESYIRLWNLKGEKLKGLRSDFQESSIKDGEHLLPFTRIFSVIVQVAALKRLKDRHATSTRKLIGHSGPIYSAVFDPVAGTSTPPRHLLSSSADGTARLWSLDTMSNVAVYRSHENPVWDAQWSPMGIYFATASRDRTARLWTTDKISPLRIFAGHLSDVDVSASSNYGAETQ
jgi:transcription initiation factor TFIID subunit 5